MNCRHLFILKVFSASAADSFITLTEYESGLRVGFAYLFAVRVSSGIKIGGPLLGLVLVLWVVLGLEEFK